eukprot:UN07976
MAELHMLHKSYTDRHSSLDEEILGLAQKHSMNWEAIAAEKGGSKDLYRERWRSIMENSELFWSFWYENRHVVCENRERHSGVRRRRRSSRKGHLQLDSATG